MKLVKREFIENPKKNEQAAHDADTEAGNIDKGIKAVLKKLRRVTSE